MAKFYKKKNFILPVLLLIVISLFFFSGKLSNTSEKISSISSAQNLQLFPTKAPGETTTEVHSADGEMKVVMKKVNKIDSDFTTYTFTVSDISGDSPKTIFTTTLGENQAIQIPDNSFSPDNKYLFLKEIDSSKLSFFVFKASGETFSEGRDFIDVVPLFEDKKYESKLSDITGWDSDTLLHIFTVKEDNLRGPSFWFDVESKNFYKLGSR